MFRKWYENENTLIQLSIISIGCVMIAVMIAAITVFMIALTIKFPALILLWVAGFLGYIAWLIIRYNAFERNRR